MANPQAPAIRSLAERLAAGPVICAEGYLFEFERRGYLQAGTFVPEVVLRHPEIVAQSHRDFVHAGSDVVLAFTYYGHRAKLRLIGKEELLEPLNRTALEIARAVAAEAEGEPPLVAGNICNTNLYDPHDESSWAEAGAMFEEQVAWAAQAGVDYIVAETFNYVGEALLALNAIRAAGLPAAVTYAVPAEGRLLDGASPAEGCKALADAGAAVVGVNCYRGPEMTLALLGDIRAAVECPVAALPVPYRTTLAHPTFFNIPDPGCACLPEGRAFPTALEPLSCNRYEIAAFALAAHEMGVDYLGVCCGAAPVHIRALAEALGRTPPASAYSPDMSKHVFFGTDEALKPHLTGGRDRM